jgi:hypothetical protein
MKILMISLLAMIFSVSVSAQNQGRGRMDPNRKINQLEKVKLMETLEIDDAAAVKFFNLKDRHHQNMTELRDNSDKILDIIEETLLEDGSKTNSSLNKLIEDFKTNEAEMNQERLRYLQEAESLLPPGEFAKLLVFERNFRAEVRNLIMGNKMRRQGRQGNN